MGALDALLVYIVDRAAFIFGIKFLLYSSNYLKFISRPVSPSVPKISEICAQI